MPKVKLYTLSTCPWCHRAKRFFQDKHIAVDCVDYDLAGAKEQEKILAEMKGYGGGESFPLIVIGGEVIEGFDPERFSQCLGLDG